MSILNKFRSLSSILVLLVVIVGAKAQRPSVDDIVARAGRQVPVYIDTFRNLLSQENKTFDIYGKDGEVKKRRTITSTFIVYPLSRDENRIAEFRNVLEVDGKKLKDSDARAQDFFRKVISSESSHKELDRLEKESSRYDEEVAISGMTLFQSPVLAPEMRQFFQFHLDGSEIIDGADTYVVSYIQTRPSADVVVNSKDQDNKKTWRQYYDVDVDKDGDLNARINGKIWIDAATFQIRREMRQLTLQPQGADTPIMAITDEFEYQSSQFGIFTPKRIRHAQYAVKTKSASSQKEAVVLMEYANFTRPDVEVKSAEVK
jgi:hypothetical protein